MRVRSTAEIRGTPEMFPQTDQRQEAFYPDYGQGEAMGNPATPLQSWTCSWFLIIRLTHLNEVNWLGTLSSSSTSSLMFTGVTGLGLPDVSRVKLASLQRVAVVYLKSALLFPR